jgi:hypothetical protein
VIEGFDRNNSFVAVKFSVFAPQMKDGDIEFEREQGFTEERKGRWIEESPLSDVVRGIRRSLIDIPGDISLKRTFSRAKREKSDLGRRIDQLKFQIGNTKSRNDTSRPTMTKR